MSSKRKTPAKLARPVVKQRAKAPFRPSINESKASVSTVSKPLERISAVEPIEISSDSSSDYGDIRDSEEDASEDEAVKHALKGKNKLGEISDDTTRLKKLQSKEDADTDMPSPPQTRGRDDVVEDSDDEATSPTFGELVQRNEVLDVAAALTTQQEATPNSAVALQTQVPAPPSLSSLGTVLNQALRTDDDDLLESCLNTTDLHTTRNTINRLDSRLAGALVSKLAARMHRRPGRAHNLMVWVQWTLVAHGAALATQPDVMKTLAPLSRVLDERAKGLERLLMLKGKLDMLESQLQLRRMNRTRGRSRKAEADSDSEEDPGEEGVVYVEGEEEEEDTGRLNGVARSPGDADEADDFPVANGVDDSEDEESGDSDGVDENDEMEVASVESMDEDDVDHEDIEESGEEDDSDVEAAPPAKVRKTGKAFSRR